MQYHVHRARQILKAEYGPENWAHPPSAKDLAGYHEHRRCVLLDKRRFELAQLRDKLDARLHAYAKEQREIAELTPYPGPNGTMWAIPYPIVACESGGDFGAYNSGYEPDGPGSGPGGAYQIIRSTWQAHGGGGVAAGAPEADQHRVASNIWAGGAGRGQWEC